MPATEKTWRDNRTMHVIFACASVAMLAVTVWMMVADHYGREWKEHTTKARGAEMWMATNRRIAFHTREYLEKQQQLEERLSEIRTTPPESEDLDAFVEIAEDCAAALKAELELEESPLVFDGLKDDLYRLRKALMGRLEDSVNAARTDYSKAQQAVAAAHRELEAATAAQVQARKDAETAAKSTAKDAPALQAAAQESVKTATQRIARGHEDLQTAERAAEEARTSKLDAERIAGDDRDELIDALGDVVRRIKTYEENTDAKRKTRSAFYDEARSNLDLANAHAASAEQSDKLQKEVDRTKQSVDELVAIVEIAKDYRARLKEILGKLTAEEEAVLKQIVTHEESLAALQTQVDEGRDSWWRRLLASPIIDIFGKGDNAIAQHWIPERTLNFNFSKVARFDRCISCHRSIEKTYGGPTTPSFLPESHITVILRTPPAAPAFDAGDKVLARHFTAEQLATFQNDDPADDDPAVTLMQAYGMRLLQGGPLNKDDVAVSFAWPKSLAAKAGLQTGDVIEQINGAPVGTLGEAQTQLVDTVAWGKPLVLPVRRGLPHPYSTHPRLDLFGTADSPHPFGKMGCTLCHDGQGSSTDFINAVHVPNSEAERAEWRKKYGWYKNHHWPFPMYPQRFREATCLKCHHDVTELEPSERFPEPPAPKLVAGYHLVRRYGCFGCHEINGFDGPTKRIGPDLRAEPNYAAAAKQILFQLPGRLQPLAAKQKALVTELDDLQGTLAKLQKQDDDLYNEAKALKDAAKKNNTPPNPIELTRIEDARDALVPNIEAAAADVAAKQVELQPVAALVDELELAEEKAHAVADHPEDSASRRRLLELIDDDAKRDADDQDSASRRLLLEWANGVAKLDANDPGYTFSTATHNVSSVLQDTDTPGKFRRVGPSLRHVGEKLSLEFLTAWLEDPTHFRPSTRMPRFFGLHDHMQGDKKQQAEHFERVEIRAIAYFLLKNSQPFTPVDQPTSQKTAPGLPERRFAAADAARGRRLFEQRGCLACHSNKDQPEGQADQGPDLSQIGAKLRLTDNDKGQKWLYSWVRQPNRYHARTVMPDLFLDEPTALEDGTPTDAAADITKYLMESGDWKPKNAGQPNWPPLADPTSPTADDQQILADLQALTEIHLTKALRSERLSKKFLDAALAGNEAGRKIATRIAKAFRSDEAALTDLTSANKAERMLDYIGRRTLSHRGCFGCHDIAGYEDAKPIGTALADWGRKDPSKLAYEQIAGYLHHKQAGHDGHDHASKESPGDFFIRGLVSHHEVTRESFLWQKLREPRSFDYNKTENKGYLDQLRMPQFNFSSEQNEQIMTFVLGLVAEPPGEVFVYKPNPRRKAILEGAKVLAQFNCAGCHSLSMERWELAYEPGQFAATMTPSKPGFLFLDRHWTADEIAESLKEDAAGLRRATLIGEPQRDVKTGELTEVDVDGEAIEDGLAVHYKFQLWQDGLLDGLRLRTGDTVFIPQSQLRRHDGEGGDFARLLRTRLRQDELASVGNIAPAREQEIAGSVPPPLVGEGRKVQGAWLHGFLLAPSRIRPAVVPRMPRFTMSSAEATAIVNYFAALDNAEYPFESDPRTRDSRQDELDHEYLRRLKASLSAPDFAKRIADHQTTFYGNEDLRLGDAMRIVTSRDFCVTCHRVGDFTPEKADSGQAPNLADVGRRLRPDYLRRWIANPVRLLPFTGMPQNIKPTEPLKQSLYHGDSVEQLDALVDLLMNFDRYMKHRTSITNMVPPVKVEAAAKKVDEVSPP